MSKLPKSQAEALNYSKQTMSFLEELVGGATHEINNLLFIIDMNSELLEMDNNDSSRKEAIGNIDEQTKKIVKIMNELRNIIKDCELEEEKEVSLNQVSNQVIQLTKTRFNNHKIILKNNIDENILLKGKEHQLAQALLALLNSAHDSVRGNRGFSRWISLDTQIKGDSLDLIVRDSGEKILPQEQDKLFTAQFETKSRKGLPLLIAKNIVESHGGTIKYLDEGVNNAFIISFPSYRVANSNVLSLVKVA